jgi:hypothetical protein
VTQLLKISHSELRTWTSCRRRWYLGYYRGLKPRRETTTGVVHVGSHVHLALEGYHGYALDPLEVLRWSYEDVIRQQPDDEAQLRKDLDLALAIVEGYVQWSLENGIDAALEVVATEHELTHIVTLPRSGWQVEWRGKLDVLFRRLDDHRYQLRDYKSVAGFTKANLLLLDTQMRFYSMLLAFSFPEAADRSNEVLYLMLKRSKRTARATPPFYEVATVSYNRHDLNATYLRALAVSEEIVQARRRLDGSLEGPHSDDHHYTCYPTPSDFCTWGCSFFKVCHLADDGSRFEDALAEHYEPGDVYAYYSDSRIQRAVAELGGSRGERR